MLTTDQPDLEGVPDRVQFKRNASQYLLLWPIPMTDNLAHDLDHLSYSFRRGNRQYQVTWHITYLGHFSGLLMNTQDLPHARPILTCTITPNLEKTPALPPRCPNCRIDFNRKRYEAKTPIKKHEMGFQKIAQVLATALACELPASQRRLVLFSDSRQDAAKLSAGIEQDHYRDILRQILYRDAQQFHHLLRSALKVTLNRTEHPQAIREQLCIINPALTECLNTNNALQDRDQDNYQRFRALFANSHFQWLDDLRFNPQAVLETPEFRRLLQHYPQIIALNDVSKGIKEALLELGHNPAGFDQRFQKTDEQHHSKAWYELFNWHTRPVQTRHNLNEADWRLISRIEQGLLSNLMEVIFLHRKRCLEALGLAYVSVSPVDFPDPHERSAINGLVRTLGLKRRYSGSDYVWDGNNQVLPDYVNQYLQQCALNPQATIQKLWQHRILLASAEGAVLNPEQLYLCLASENTQAYTCPVCASTFLHPAGGYCPDCLSSQRSVPSEQVRLRPGRILPEPDYYTYLTESAGDPFRFHTEELTGQTFDAQRPKRQR